MVEMHRVDGRRVLVMLLLVVLLMAGLGGAPAARAATITVPAGDVAALVAAINAANATPEPDEIVLAAGAIYTLTAIDNADIFGPNGLPWITSPMTIVGNGATITRSNTAPEFRILSVAFGATMTLQQVIISNGATTSDGAGIINRGTLTLTDSTVSGNHSTFNGGGISNSGVLTMTNSTVSGNSAVRGGGGIVNGGFTARLTLTNCTLSGNSSNNGGGIYHTDFGVLTMTNSTFTGNSASSHGGGIHANTIVAPTNTIVAGNTAPLGPDIIGSAYGSFNLIGNGAEMGGLIHGTDGNQVGTSQAPIDPRLGPLVDNGGPTRTHLPNPDSPTINAADTATAPSNDQRGVGRPQGAASDIGAVEVVVLTHAELCTLTQAKVRQQALARTACTLLTHAARADIAGSLELERLLLRYYELQIRIAQRFRGVTAADADELIAWSRLL